MKIRIRAALVEARTSLVHAARGFAKTARERLPACDTDSMGVEKMEALPAPLQETLRQVSGVGTLIALTFVLTEDRDRFRKSRDVGCYVGLRPKQSESGQSQP
jgi:transposase